MSDYFLVYFWYIIIAGTPLGSQAREGDESLPHNKNYRALKQARHATCTSSSLQ
jgi:hypothetical protein